jgi:hypothetical protein
MPKIGSHAKNFLNRGVVQALDFDCFMQNFDNFSSRRFK